MKQPDFTFELKSGRKTKAVFTINHGLMIRKYHWDRDAQLKKSGEFLEFLFNEGLKGPLQLDLQEGILDYHKDEEFNKWLEDSPKLFSKLNNRQIEFTNVNLLENLKKDLASELPNMDLQILSLLKSLGTLDNLWHGFYYFEKFLIKILQLYSLKDIVSIYSKYQDDKLIILGAGYYLCHPMYIEKISSQIHLLTRESIKTIELAFENINYTLGLELIRELLEKKRIANIA